MDEVWTLQRSTTDGKLAGVCAAVATRYGIDPLLVRIVCVLLALSDGVGLALYGAAWALLPTDKDPVPPLQRMIPALGQWSRTTLSICVAVWTLVVVVVAGQFLTIGLGPVLIVAALWWFGVIKPRNAVADRRAAALPAPTAAEQAFVEEALAWRARVEAQVSGVNWSSPAVVPTRVIPTRAVAEPYAWQPAPWANTYEAAEPAQEAARFVAQPATSLNVESPASSAALARSRRRRLLGWATLSIAAGVWLAMFAVGGSLEAAVASTLVVVGCGLVVAAWLGRPKGLLPAGVVLMLLTLGSLGSAQAIEGTVLQPTEVTALPSSVSASVGDVVVDLSQVSEPATRTVSIHVAAGNVTVICPEDVNLVVEARMGAGQYRGIDAQADGPGSFRFDQRPDPDAPVLTLKVDMGLGDLEVIRP